MRHNNYKYLYFQNYVFSLFICIFFFFSNLINLVHCTSVLMCVVFLCAKVEVYVVVVKCSSRKKSKFINVFASTLFIFLQVSSQNVLTSLTFYFT